MKTINIADILDKCTKGTKLYSPIFGDVYLHNIRPHLAIIVNVAKDGICLEEFLYDGRYTVDGECVLFPSKENRDWSTFKKPKFKNGDVIVSASDNIALFSHTEKNHNGDKNIVYYHCVLLNNLFKSKPLKIKIDCGIGYDEDCTLATDAQKKKLFKAIEEAGYEWDSKEGVLKPSLEAMLKTFKKGDCIKVDFPEGNYAVAIVDSIKDYTINVKCSIFSSDYVFDEGTLTKRDDIKVQKATKEQKAYLLARVYETYKRTWNEKTKELESPKFDFTSFKPFDKVLVRDCGVSTWRCDLFSHFHRDTTHRKYHLASNESAVYCIPYNDDTSHIALLAHLSLDFIAGFVGVLLIDIYGILIEKGKL